MVIGGFAGRPSVWVRLVLAVVAVVVGAVLLVHPFGSLELLLVLVGVGCLLTAGLTFASGERERGRRVGLGGAWLLAGLLVLTWPNLSARAVAVVAGCALVVHGLFDLIAALGGRRARVDRVAVLLQGLTALVLGVIALSWPDVTIFVIAVLFGAGVLLFGVSQLVQIVVRRPATADFSAAELAVGDGNQQVRRRGWRRVLHLAVRSAALLVTLLLLAVSVTLHRAAPAAPPDFYAAPTSTPSTPGQLLRVEPFVGHGVPAGAQAWLILYTTQTALRTPTVASAIVLAATGRPAGPRPLIAWDHGTVGIAPACAPSLSPDAFTGSVALPQLLANGWVMVATDYTGMGTAGVSPYLIGAGEAYSTLDSIRAAYQLTDVQLSADTVVWGHSQGGHAALWTGMLAHSYAPELRIDGVAALSPVTDLSFP